MAFSIKHLAVLALLLALIVIPSSAKRVLFLSKYRVVKSDVVMATAYNSMESQCDGTPWITASGTKCRPGVVAANHLPIGTKIVIEGFGNKIFTVEDRMNRRYTKRVDIWMLKYQDARKFGKRKIKYYILERV